MNLSLSSLLASLSKLLAVASSLVLLLVASSNLQAEGFKFPDLSEDRHGGFTLTPMVGSYRFDDDRGLDDDTALGLALGYRFSDPFAVEFVYLNGDVTTTTGATAGDLKQYRLEALYDVAHYGAWTPYIAVGAASTEFGNTTTADNEGAMTFGVGTHYSFSERVALRLDSRYIKAVGDTKGADVALALGLNVFLGQTEPKVVTPEVVEDKPVATPAPTGPSLSELCAQAGGSLFADGNCVRTSLKTERVTLNVQFEVNSDKVQTAYLGEVEKLADFMRTYPTASVVIEGHTDSSGSDAYNQNLSQRRVNEVMRVLATDYGIAAARMSAVGYGESQPLMPNDSAENRAKNRRVVASIRVELEETIQFDVK